jgi:phosphomannomutase
MDVDIRFGTDGWRALIAQDFTFDNVRMVAQALCDYLDEKREDRRVAVGYDRRFLSEDFARAVAEVLAGNGVTAYLSPEACPTPFVSYYVRQHDIPLGVVITASHNSYRWNGIKIKERFGGSAGPETTRAIQDLLGKSPVRSVPFREGKNSGRIVETSLDEGYDRLVESIVDIAAIRNSHLRVVADSMNGVGGRLLERWASSPTCKVTTLRADRDTMFGSLAPEPKEEYLDLLRDAVLCEKADIGLATDGDGDRSGGVRSDGEIFTPLEMVALLALYLIEVRQVKGTLVANNANTLYMGKIAAEFGIPFTNLPVGFKYIADLMRREQVIIGGEESGGIAVQGFLPERDGVLINLLILEMLVKRGKTVQDLLKDLYTRYGEFHFRRRDFPMSQEAGLKQVSALVQSPPAQIEGFDVTDVQTLDGTKLLFHGGSWLLFRQSGTEPTLRVYCEAPSRAQAERLIATGVKAVQAMGAKG